MGRRISGLLKGCLVASGLAFATPVRAAGDSYYVGYMHDNYVKSHSPHTLNIGMGRVVPAAEQYRYNDMFVSEAMGTGLFFPDFVGYVDVGMGLSRVEGYDIESYDDQAMFAATGTTLGGLGMKGGDATEYFMKVGMSDKFVGLEFEVGSVEHDGMGFDDDPSNPVNSAVLPHYNPATGDDPMTGQPYPLTPVVIDYNQSIKILQGGLNIVMHLFGVNSRSPVNPFFGVGAGFAKFKLKESGVLNYENSISINAPIPATCDRSNAGIAGDTLSQGDNASTCEDPVGTWVETATGSCTDGSYVNDRAGCIGSFATWDPARNGGLGECVGFSGITDATTCNATHNVFTPNPVDHCTTSFTGTFNQTQCGLTGTYDPGEPDRTITGWEVDRLAFDSAEEGINTSYYKVFGGVALRYSEYASLVLSYNYTKYQKPKFTRMRVDDLERTAALIGLRMYF